ncbi:hypothetical protein JKF63_07210 [Porcisia hertigi]|uniref:Uncharacterized protein n=1 Tax=Porcisia hertigi TaxID=2761500 RepID=A0A836LL61_9TRYP|nr:hypothetical protein JKF63_07210 [Porcisia hertigi]
MDRIRPLNISPRLARVRWGWCVLLMWAWVATTILLSHCALAWPQFLHVKRPEQLPLSELVKADDMHVIVPSRVLLHSAEERGVQARMLLEEFEAKGRLSPCWKRSLQLLHAKCSEVQSEDTMRSRLGLLMATCDARSDGRAHPSFHCASEVTQLSASEVRQCVQDLSDSAYAAFLQYRLHADVLCAYLEEEVYQQRTEAAVAAMHLQMQRSAEMLTALQHSGAEVLAVMKDSQKFQHESREAASSLRDLLDHLQRGQIAALQALQRATDDILHTSTRTDVALGDLHTRVQEVAAEALTSIQALSHESQMKFAEVEAQTRGVVRLIRQMDDLHHLLTRQHISSNRVVWILGSISGVLILTCLRQTAAARLPATLFTVAGSVGVPLLQWWSGQAWWLLLHETVWEFLCLSTAVGFVVHSAYHYTTPSKCRHQGLEREESMCVWGELQLPQQPLHQPAGALVYKHTPRIPLMSFEPHLRLVGNAASAQTWDAADTPSPLSIVVSPRVEEAEVISTRDDDAPVTAHNEDTVSLPDNLPSTARTPNRKRCRPVAADNDTARKRTKTQRCNPASGHSCLAAVTKRPAARRNSRATRSKG